MNEEKNIIEIQRINGNVEEAEVLLFFKLEENGQEYIVYTFNEQEDDLITVYTSKFIKNENNIVLEEVTDEEEWNKIKDVMRRAITESKED